jgi:hypothetical protein
MLFTNVFLILHLCYSRLGLTFSLEIGRAGHKCNSLVEHPVADVEVLVHRTADVFALDTLGFESVVNGARGMYCRPVDRLIPARTAETRMASTPIWMTRPRTW